MVFMGVETESGNAPLIEAAKADIKEMKAVGSGGKLNILVQVHGKGVPRRYHIGMGNPDGDEVPVGEREVKGGRALANFISWSLTNPAVKHRQTDESMLVSWGHAYDFAIGHAQTRSGTIDALDFVELGQVLGGLQHEISKYYGTKHQSKLDIVAFDACDVATVEMALQLYPFAKYLLGSEMGVPIPGWPYDRISVGSGIRRAGSWVRRNSAPTLCVDIASLNRHSNALCR